MPLATAHPLAQPLNADFYTAAATVIPVLFLAIAVQGRVYEDLIRSGVRRVTASVRLGYNYPALRRAVRAGAITRQQARRMFFDPRDSLRLATGVVFVVIAAFIVLYSVVAEVLALSSLRAGQAGASPEMIFEVAAILTLAAAVTPALALGRAVAGLYREIKRASQTATPVISQAPAAPPPDPGYL